MKFPKIKFNKRFKYYSINILSLVFILFLGFIFAWVHSYFIQQKILIEFIRLWSLDFSIILIPTMIFLNNRHKTFKNDKDKIFTLLEELIMLRYDISDEILKKKSILLMKNPIIIKEIKILLRYFDFTHDADIIHSLVKKNMLSHIDQLIIKIIKHTTLFDGGKECKRRRGESSENIKDINEELKKNSNYFSFNYNNPNNPVRQKCIENLAYVLAYDLYKAGDKSIPISTFYDT